MCDYVASNAALHSNNKKKKKKKKKKKRYFIFSILTLVAMEIGHFLKMLNDASLASLGLLMQKVMGCIICKKTIVGRGRRGKLANGAR